MKNSYEMLATAIIVRASRDYAQAIIDDYRPTIDECEKFFKSKWFSALTKSSPYMIMDKIKRTALEFKEKTEKYISKNQITDYAGTYMWRKEAVAFGCPICGGAVRVWRGTITQTYGRDVNGKKVADTKTVGVKSKCCNCDARLYLDKTIMIV